MEKRAQIQKRKIIRNDHAILAGRFGRINAMVQMTPANRNKAMMEYEEEDILAKKCSNFMNKYNKKRKEEW